MTLPSGVHCRTTFPTTSLNHRAPSGRHNGPSMNWNPPASFSILASFGTSASRAGSSRVMLPIAGASGGDTGGGVGAVEQPIIRIAAANTNGVFMFAKV